MEQKVERKPLLSDETLKGEPSFDNLGGKWIEHFPRAMNGWTVRDHYEGMIDRGELVIRNKCKQCGNLWTPTFITNDVCPGCGAKIID